LDQASPQPANSVPEEPGLLEQARRLWDATRGVAHDQVRLLALEAKQAGTRLALMLGLAVMAVALLATAWLGLVALVVLLLIEAGASPVVAVLVAVAANLAGAVTCGLALRSHARETPFAATLRSLRRP
jgi:uncharacterized membrane protein YqjE